LPSWSSALARGLPPGAHVWWREHSDEHDVVRSMEALPRRSAHETRKDCSEDTV
jgi:hypothetical protein